MDVWSWVVEASDQLFGVTYFHIFVCDYANKRICCFIQKRCAQYFILKFSLSRHTNLIVHGILYGLPEDDFQHARVPSWHMTHSNKCEQEFAFIPLGSKGHNLSKGEV